MFTRIVNGYQQMSDAKLIGEANSIISSLQANFATAPGLPPLIAARDAATLSMAEAADGGKYSKAQRKERRTELIHQLHVMGSYIMYITSGSQELIAGSGFKTAKIPVPKPAPTPAQDQQLVNGINSGELDYSFGPVPGSEGYIYAITPDPITPDSKWDTYTGTKASYLFTGLESSKRYWAKVTAIGPNGGPATSDPVSRIVI